MAGCPTWHSSCQAAVCWRGAEAPGAVKSRGVTLVASSTFAELPQVVSRDHRAALPLACEGGLQLSAGPVGRTKTAKIADEGNEVLPMFEELYELLSRYKIDAADRFRSVSMANRRALSGRIGLFFRDNLDQLLSVIEDSQGLVFNFDRFDPKVNALDKVARKAIFYSDVAVALLEAEVRFASPTDAFKNKRKKIRRQVWATNIGPLVETLLAIRPLVERGILVPLPNSIWFDEEMHETMQFRYDDVIDKIRRGQLRNVIIPVTLDRWAIRRQIEEFESENRRLAHLRPVKLLLPQLRGVSTDTLLRIREDNYDAFARFQGALRDFAATSQLISSETAFLDIARKVDHEIHTLEQRVKSLANDRRRHGWEVTLGMALSSLTLLLDADLVKVLAPIIGAKTVWDGVQYLRLGGAKVSDDDYYMAYLVAKMRSQVSPKT